MTANERRRILGYLAKEAEVGEFQLLHSGEASLRDVLEVVEVAMYPRREEYISLAAWIERLDVASELLSCAIHGNDPNELTNQPTAVPRVKELPYLLSSNVAISGDGRELRVQIEYPKEAEMKGFTK